MPKSKMHLVGTAAAALALVALVGCETRTVSSANFGAAPMFSGDPKPPPDIDSQRPDQGVDFPNPLNLIGAVLGLIFQPSFSVPNPSPGSSQSTSTTTGASPGLVPVPSPTVSSSSSSQ